MFDFTYKNKVPYYFCFKVEQPLTSFINEGYVDEVARNRDKSVYNEKDDLTELTVNDIRIERNKHLCQDKSGVNFAHNFK